MKKLHKFTMFALIAIMVLSFAGCGSSESTDDTDNNNEKEAAAVLEDTSTAETIFEELDFDNVHQHAVYHDTNNGNLEFDTYYFKNDEGLVSVLWLGSDGNVLYVNENKAVSKSSDGAISVVARSEDETFKEEYLSMISGSLFYDKDPNESIIDSHIEDGIRTITIQTPVEKSIPAESIKNLWGIEDGTLKTIFTIDMEEKEFISCDQYIIGDDEKETKIYTSTFEYNVDFERDSDMEKAD